MRMAPGYCSAATAAFAYVGPRCYTVGATPGIAQSLYAKVSGEKPSCVKAVEYMYTCCFKCLTVMLHYFYSFESCCMNRLAFLILCCLIFLSFDFLVRVRYDELCFKHGCGKIKHMAEPPDFCTSVEPATLPL